MRIRSFAILSATCLLLGSCKKQKTGSSTDLSIKNPTDYVLTKVTWSGIPANGRWINFSYNAGNLVDTIALYGWNGSTNNVSDTEIQVFSYTDCLATKIVYLDNGKQLGYDILEYNENRLPSKSTHYTVYSPPEPSYYYAYTSIGSFISKSSSNQVNDYSYAQSGNMINETDHLLWRTPNQIYKFDFLVYDSKVNFIRTVNGLPPSTYFFNWFGVHSSFSPNNVLSDNLFTPVNVDTAFKSPVPETYSYQYNINDLPIKCVSGSQIITFEYKKYR